ncbi:MAG: GFA family protein, partial [Comamonadaceae bacterium]
TAFRANIPAPAAGFRLLRGSPRTYVKVAASGARRVLAFCEVCGTPLYACAEERPQSYSLRTGTLRQRGELGTPSRQIWTRRRLPWTVQVDEVPGFDGQP